MYALIKAESGVKTNALPTGSENGRLLLQKPSHVNQKLDHKFDQTHSFRVHVLSLVYDVSRRAVKRTSTACVIPLKKAGRINFKKDVLTNNTICNKLPSMAIDIRFDESKLNELESRCREQGVPLTLQRRAILQDLAGRCDHPTADQIYDTICIRYPGISRTTVYRVLDTFVQLGIAQKISNPEARARFDADTRHHHHLVCRACDTVADFSCDELDRLTLPPELENGFLVSTYSLTITGLCPCCREQGATNRKSGRFGTRHIPQRRNT
jgi:Fur family peroxide stress response transcriptional regulator